MGRFSKGPNILKTGLFKIQIFLYGFPMVYDKMGAICLDFKLLTTGFKIPFEIQTICKPTLLTILNLVKSRYVQISDPPCILQTAMNKSSFEECTRWFTFIKMGWLPNTFRKILQNFVLNKLLIKTAFEPNSGESGYRLDIRRRGEYRKVES